MTVSIKKNLLKDTLNWEKKGLIYKPDGSGFFKTHAARPIPFRISEKILRLFFSSRDFDDRMFPTYIDVNIDNPKEVLYIHDAPLLNLGKIGTFDDSGVTLASLIQNNNSLLMYYTGWKRRRINVNFDLSIGLATLFMNEKNCVLKRRFLGPILAQDKNHPILVAGPYVIKEEALYKMWYCFGTKWHTTETGIEPLYRIHYAESKNGIDWNCFTDKPCIDYDYDGEVLSAPWVIKINGLYYMWYSKRGSATKDAKNYTIGFASSKDGISWTRNDQIAGIERSPKGWDSEMICYPSFISHQDKTYMFYSGNHVGRGGIGYATTDRFF